MKARIGVDADSGLVHTEVGTAANVNDVTQAHALVHGNESDVFANSGYQGVGKRDETQDIKVNWHVAMRPGKRRVLDMDTPMGAHHSDTRRYRADVQRRHRGEGVFLCFATSVSAYWVLPRTPPRGWGSAISRRAGRPWCRCP
jgi:IS5 family transposase